MALLWTDGMDRYGTAADFKSNAGYYALQPSSYQPTGGKTGGGCARLASSAGVFQKVFANPGSIPGGNGVHFCGWFKCATLAGGPNEILMLGTNVWPSNSSPNARLMLNSDGSLTAYMHGVFTALATSAVVITPGTYAHIEYAAKYNASGYVKVWVNGNIVINFAGNTVSGTTPSQYTDFACSNSAGSSNHDWDDVICWDETGTDFANLQLTTAYLPVIETLSVDGNDAVQFTPSTGSNFQNVDDPAFQNGDTDYNSSGTVGQADQFTLANQASTPAYTFGVALKTVAKIDIAGTVNLRTRLVSGATTTDSADRPLSTAYALYVDYFGKDPATAAAWAATQANNLKCGYKYQS